MATGLSSPLAVLLRAVSRIACLFVVLSFAIFVYHQASDASDEQQNEVAASAPATSGNPTLPTSQTAAPKSAAHKVIDEVSDQLTSPFSGLTSGLSSQWLLRGANLVLALLLYGFALSYLARMIRVRV